MLWRNSEVQIHLAVFVSGILCAFLQMFFKWGVGIATCGFVEFEQSLWQEAVVQTFRFKHRFHHVHIPSCRHQFLHI